MVRVVAEDRIREHPIAERLALAAVEKKANDVVVLDMTDLVDYADAIVLCTAQNRRHTQAIADAVRQAAKQHAGSRPVTIEGTDAAQWVLVDAGSVVVHVFDPNARTFYNLDGLWSDAPRREMSDADDPPTETPLRSL